MSLPSEHEGIEPSMLSHIILGKVNFNISDYEEISPDCSLLNIPIGMHTELVIESRQPGETELSNLNGTINLFKDINIVRNYSISEVPIVLFNKNLPGNYNQDFDIVLPRFVKFTVKEHGNTNEVNYKCTGNTEIHTLPPNSFFYSISDDSSAQIKYFMIQYPYQSEMGVARF